MKKITLLLLLFFSMTAFGQMCDYTLEANDSFGDGWNGAIMDVLVDGVVVLDDVSLDDDPNNNQSQGLLTFAVTIGADVTTMFVDGGGFPEEVSYRILDSEGIEVGAGDVTTDIMTGTITAACPSCVRPSSLMAGNITAISADLSWTDANDPVAMSYDLEWGESGFTPGMGTVEAGLTTPMFMLGSLTPDTSYDFYVTANCGAGDSSEITGPSTFMTTVSCFAATDLAVANITNVSADLSWTDVNNPAAMSYDLEWGEAGFTLGMGTVEAGLTDPMFMLESLIPNTSYDFYVTSNCDVDDSSEVSGPFTFTTIPTMAPAGDCSYTLEMNDGFGDGWNGALMDVFRNGEIILNDVALDDDPANDGSTGSLPFEILPGDDVTTVFVAPGGFPDEVSYRILDVNGTEVGAGDATTDIMTGTITAECPSCFTPTDLAAANITDVSADLSWIDANDPAAMSYDLEWGESGFTLGMGTVEAGLTDPMFMLGGLMESTSYDFYVTANCDMDTSSEVAGPFTFMTNVSCFAPTDLTAANITETSADLSWIDANDPVAMSYDLEWGEAGFVLGTGTLEAGLTAATFQLTGLDAGTSYDFYVTANCDADDTSGVSGPLNFTTLFEQAPAGECEYTLRMQDSFGDGWNGALLSVFRNGQIVLDSVTLDDDPANDGFTGLLPFEVIPGDDITTALIDDGGFPAEISYDIISSNGVSVIGSGDAENDITSGTVIATTCSLSVDENSLEDFSFFPNPAQDVINLNTRATIDNVAIFNLLGQKVLEQKVDGVSTYQLGVSTLAKGTYLMQVTSNDNTGVYQIIKM